MHTLYSMLFLLPFFAVPALCAWMYARKGWISQLGSYLLNALLTFVLPFTWHWFQDPVAISNSVPLFSSLSVFMLGNLIFGIPSSLIFQIFMNFVLKPSVSENQPDLPESQAV